MHDAIAAADWPRALAIALAAWRASRAVELAELVDAIAARVEAQPVTRLRADVADLAAIDTPTKFVAVVDRFATLTASPDDPRATAGLVDLLATMPFDWWIPSREVFYDRVAAAIADARALPALRRIADAPMGENADTRALQSRLAAEAIARIPIPAPDAQAAAMLARLRGAAPADLAPLWHEVARVRDDDGPRHVLADALIERGDPRGEMIALQLAGTSRAENLSLRLINRHWQSWLGELLVLVTRRGTAFRRGFLDDIRIGMLRTPAWAFERLPAHRELAVVRTVRANQIAPVDFARFVAALPPLDGLGVVGPDFAAPLAAARPTWPVRVLEYAHTPGHATLREGVDTLVPILPALAEVHFLYNHYLVDEVELARVIHAFRERIPALRITIERKLVAPGFAAPAGVELR